MVGQWTVTKPSRSDEVLDADQQLEIANQIRAQFDSLAPKRPTKPNRSEPDSTTPTDQSPVVTTMDHGIPELDKLRFLQSQSHVYVKFSVEGDTVQDEFVETEYYKELGFIDKQHHTTGTGFIRVVREEGDEDACHALHLGTSHGASADKPAFSSNPATNDWIPSNEEEDRVFVSSKPSRSESS